MRRTRIFEAEIEKGSSIHGDVSGKKKFISSEAYNHALAEQYKQGFRSGLSEGFEIFRRYAMKVDVNGKWLTVDYYKALAVGATHYE
ncbi:hypothetical protein DVH24_013420 [Malus domestica]|uniref:Uncharacterized protein n=1 Tax=Malus domestica TaxID=3750 RepID=A0A498HK24_MALDO|nr:hypothetical protein DVH24_013420 [Malus domestica]